MSLEMTAIMLFTRLPDIWSTRHTWSLTPSTSPTQKISSRSLLPPSNSQCNWCLLNPSMLKLWTWVALVMRSNCNFPLFSIFKLNSGKSGRNSLLSWHAVHPDSELGNCIKVGIAWLSSYGQFVAGVIYKHDMSMQMMACGKWPTIIASVVVVIKYKFLLQNNTSRAALETCSVEAQFMHFLWKYIILLQYKTL